MNSSVDSDTPSEKDDGKSLGVQFAESTVGEPIIEGLLFITNSFWLMVATVGVLLSLIAMIMGYGVLAGVIGVFGFSAIFVGLLGYGTFLLLVHLKENRD